MADLHYSGIGGLILLIADIYAVVSAVNSSRSTGDKVLWVLLIVFLPLLGFIIWLVAGPRGR